MTGIELVPELVAQAVYPPENMHECNDVRHIVGDILKVRTGYVCIFKCMYVYMCVCVCVCVCV
jgi:hypothetical protein